MKLIVAMMFVLCSSAFANTHVFEDSKNVILTEYPCLWRTARCDLQDMENDLIAECYNSGYDTCTLLSATTRRTYTNPNGICGYTTKHVCEVKVKGRR